VVTLSAERRSASVGDRPLTLITGGTRGIGAATAVQLARAGHDLVLGFHDDAAAADDCRRHVEEAGARCRVVRADVTEAAGVSRLFEGAAEVGVLTGVVNNAGATFHLGPLAETPVDVVQRTVELNLTAALLVARTAVRTMGTTYGGRGGVLVNVSSVAARLGAPGEYVQYAAAKAGVESFTRGLAQEVAGEGIRVVAVAPGIVRTRIHADAGDAARLDRVGGAVPLGRPGEPHEVADAIAWLMSDRASYVTGSTLEVAGGR
jgi:NAD(P)-dependent dehydrogenase (short-subunit alcohol dehydrogenase family)